VTGLKQLFSLRQPSFLAFAIGCDDYKSILLRRKIGKLNLRPYGPLFNRIAECWTSSPLQGPTSNRRIEVFSIEGCWGLGMDPLGPRRLLAGSSGGA